MNPSMVLATSSRVRFISFLDNRMNLESQRRKPALKAVLTLRHATQGDREG